MSGLLHDDEAKWYGDVVPLEPVPEAFWVVDNVTGERVSRTWPQRSAAVQVCGALNTQAGPGGRYGVAPRVRVTAEHVGEINL